MGSRTILDCECHKLWPIIDLFEGYISSRSSESEGGKGGTWPKLALYMVARNDTRMWHVDYDLHAAGDHAIMPHIDHNK